MKVLYLAGMYPRPDDPQFGIFCHEQVKELIKAKIDVDVVVPYQFYKRDIRIKEWTYESVHIKYVPYFKMPGTLDFHLAGYALYQVLNRKINLDQYDIFHADGALPLGQALMIASQRYNIPFVVYGHGLDMYLDVSYEHKKNKNAIIKASEEVYSNANAIVGVSQKVIDVVCMRQNVKHKCNVVYNGVDTSRFFPIEKHNDPLVICSIGNLIPLKGHDYTIKALRKVLDRYPNSMKLNIIGRGPLDLQLRKLVHELHLDNDVCFKGYIPYEKVAEELRKSDIFILPSWYEALGCVYLEAMAAGLPVIGCRMNGIDEIIKDKYNGFLVDAKNEKQIAFLLTELQDAKLRKTIGIRARTSVQNGFTWTHSALALKDIYMKVKYSA